MLQSQPNIQMQAIFDLIYPVGSLYFSTTLDTVEKVKEAFGGNWQKLPEGYAIWTASEGAGSTIAAGLPGMYAQVNGIVTRYGGENGVLTLTQGTEKISVGGMGASRTLKVGTLTFDATRSSRIYNNTVKTVQPPAYKVYVYKRLSLGGA